MSAELESLVADTEAQLAAAIDAVRAGSLLDLSDLVPRLERVCGLAVAERARHLAPRLAGLVAQLNALEAVLRDRMAEGTPDPRRAAASYRAADQSAEPPSPDTAAAGRK